MNSYKNKILSRGEKINFFVLIMTIFCSIKAHGQSYVSTLSLRANITELVTISILSRGIDSDLNLNSDHEDIAVATVFESSNSSGGYVVKARSENNGHFKSLSGKQAVPYILKYGGGNAFSLTNDNQTLREQASGGITSSGKDITISFQGKSSTYLAAGKSYSDFITFTIESR